MPKVSICVPAYRNPAGIARLLSSVKEQTFTDYEVVLTDDSPDDSVKAAAENSGVKNLYYYKNASRLGATGNWNEAVRKSGGAYIKMMHHDDWFATPESLERFVGLLDRAPEAALAFCGTWQVSLTKDGEGARFARAITEKQLTLLQKDWRNLYLGNYIGAPSATIYRRNSREFEPKLTWVMDTEYYMGLLREHPHFSHTTDPLVCIGVSDSQLTESCRTDGDLNVFEYGFLMEEFGLSGQKEYRERLIGVALKYKQPFSAVKQYGIPKEEFSRAAGEKRRADFRFLLGVAKRKFLKK